MKTDTNNEYLNNILSRVGDVYGAALSVKNKFYENNTKNTFNSLTPMINELHEKMGSLVKIIESKEYEGIETWMFHGIGCAVFPESNEDEGKVTQKHLLLNLGHYIRSKNNLIIKYEMGNYIDIDELMSDIMTFSFIPSSMATLHSANIDSQIAKAITSQK